MFSVIRPHHQWQVVAKIVMFSVKCLRNVVNVTIQYLMLVGQRTIPKWLQNMRQETSLVSAKVITKHHTSMGTIPPG